MNLPLAGKPHPSWGDAVTPVGWSLCVGGVRIDPERRLVTVDGEQFSLDAPDPAPSRVLGCVWRREVAAGRIEHAVGVMGPWPVGTRFVPAPAGARASTPLGQMVMEAAAMYGFVVAVERPGPVVVLCETSGTPWDDPGPVWRAAGIGSCSGEFPIHVFV